MVESPSSGTICLIQAFIIYENILKKSQKVSLDETLSILNFIYYLRAKKLADPEFEKINLKKLLDKDELLKILSCLKRNQKLKNQWMPMNSLIQQATLQYSIALEM